MWRRGLSIDVSPERNLEPSTPSTIQSPVSDPGLLSADSYLRLGQFEITGSGLVLLGTDWEDSRPWNTSFDSLDQFIEFGPAGTGASSTVSKCVYLGKPHGVFAVKAMNIDQLGKRDQIRAELEVLCSMKHRNLIHLVNAFLKEGSVYLVLEYMNRASLHQHVKLQVKFSEADIRVVASQVLEGLVFLHRNRWIHRDIKPANILLDSRGNVKISDFGTCHQLDLSGVCRSVIGTQLFMSPERLSALPYSTAADVWSFGVCLAVFATGSLPFEGTDGILSLLQAVSNFQVEPKMFRGYSSLFLDFLSKCLNPDPVSRWNASELLSHDFLSETDETKVAHFWEGTTESDLQDAELAISMLKICNLSNDDDEYSSGKEVFEPIFEMLDLSPEDSDLVWNKSLSSMIE